MARFAIFVKERERNEPDVYLPCRTQHAMAEHQWRSSVMECMALWCLTSSQGARAEGFPSPSAATGDTAKEGLSGMGRRRLSLLVVNGSFPLPALKSSPLGRVSANEGKKQLKEEKSGNGEKEARSRRSDDYRGSKQSFRDKKHRK